MDKKLRIYIDTSVIGGCEDVEFAEASIALLQMARDSKAVLLVSNLLGVELLGAPESVRNVLASIPAGCVETVESNNETEELRNRYLEAAVVGSARTTDAHHVAIATAYRADMIVSWNFRHIVHYDKIRGFNAVNMREGYPPIAIHTPKEVV